MKEVKKRNYQSLIIGRKIGENEYGYIPKFKKTRSLRKSHSIGLNKEHMKLPVLYKYSGNVNDEKTETFKKSIFTVKINPSKSVRTFSEARKEKEGMGSLPTLESLRAEIFNKKKIKTYKSKYASMSNASTLIENDPKLELKKNKISNINKDINELNFIEKTQENLRKIGKEFQSGLLFNIDNQDEGFQSIKQEMKIFKKKKEKQNVFKKILGKKKKKKQIWKQRNPDYEDLKRKIYSTEVEYKTDDYLEKVEKKYLKKLGSSCIENLKKKGEITQKFTFDNFVLLLQSLYGDINPEILRSIKFFKRKDFDSFIKEFKFLLESTKIKEMIKYDDYLRSKISDEDYKNSYKSLAETIEKYNINTGLKNVYDKEKEFGNRDFEVGDLSEIQLKNIKKNEKKDFFRKRTKLDMKYH